MQVETVAKSTADQSPHQSPQFWIKVAVVVVGGILLVFVVRAVFVAPIDALAVRQACAAHGFDQEQPLEAVETTSKMALFDRVEATCRYGEVEVDDRTKEAFSISLEELDPGGFFTAAKWLGLVLQLSSVVVYVRVVVQPVFRRSVSS